MYPAAHRPRSRRTARRRDRRRAPRQARRRSVRRRCRWRVGQHRQRLRRYGSRRRGAGASRHLARPPGASRRSSRNASRGSARKCRVNQLEQADLTAAVAAQVEDDARATPRRSSARAQARAQLGRRSALSDHQGLVLEPAVLGDVGGRTRVVGAAPRVAPASPDRARRRARAAAGSPRGRSTRRTARSTRRASASCASAGSIGCASAT